MTTYNVQKHKIMNQMFECIRKDKGIEFIKLLNEYQCVVIGECNSKIGR